MAGSDTSSERPSLAALVDAAAARARLERSRNLLIGAFLLVVLFYTYRSTEFSPGDLVRQAPQMSRILVAFLHPDLAILRPGSGDFPEGLVLHFAVQTVEIAITGTSLGAVIAIPLSFVAASNLMRRNPIGSAVYFVVRALMSLVRAIPTIFWGILFVTSVGLGPFPGVLAVAIFSVGLMSKLFSEAIETIDAGQVEALTATGANPLQVLLHGVGPQVLPYMIAHLLYTFEVNVHSAVILGLIGAGGIGFLFQQYSEQLQYPDQAAVLMVAIGLTLVIDYSSAAIRRRII